MKNLVLPDEVAVARLTHGLFDDFHEFVSADLWTSTFDTSGTVAKGDAAGGVVVITSHSDDNDEAYLESTCEAWKFAADKPLMFEARCQYAEAATDDANILIGLMDAPGADSLLDNGGGPKASYSGACFFKVDGGTRWNVEVSIGGTQSTVELTADNSLDGVAKTAGGASYQTFRIIFRPHSSTQANVEFWIDGVHVYTFNDFVFTSATEMAMAFGAKAGGGAAEVLTVDYAMCYQTR